MDLTRCFSKSWIVIDSHKDEYVTTRHEREISFHRLNICLAEDRTWNPRWHPHTGENPSVSHESDRYRYKC